MGGASDLWDIGAQSTGAWVARASPDIAEALDEAPLLQVARKGQGKPPRREKQARGGGFDEPGFCERLQRGPMQATERRRQHEGPQGFFTHWDSCACFPGDTAFCALRLAATAVLSSPEGFSGLSSGSSALGFLAGLDRLGLLGRLLPSAPRGAKQKKSKSVHCTHTLRNIADKQKQTQRQTHMSTVHLLCSRM